VGGGAQQGGASQVNYALTRRYQFVVIFVYNMWDRYSTAYNMWKGFPHCSSFMMLQHDLIGMHITPTEKLVLIVYPNGETRLNLLPLLRNLFKFITLTENWSCRLLLHIEKYVLF
jgi:hypothetical protein